MGKITVTGTAQREVCYDAIDLRITFQSRSKKTAEAVDIVMRQCEQLLRLITEMGVKIQDIRLEETSVGRRYDDTVISKSSGVTVTASRSVTLRLKFDMPFLNRLMDAIRALDLSVNFHCSYILLNREMLQSELLRQAVEDSRRKAELIAGVTGQRVIGIDSMDYRDYCDCDPEEDERFIVEDIDLRATDEAPLSPTDWPVPSPGSPKWSASSGSSNDLRKRWNGPTSVAPFHHSAPRFNSAFALRRS